MLELVIEEEPELVVEVEELDELDELDVVVVVEELLVVVEELLVVVVVDEVVVVELVVDMTGAILWYTLTELTSQNACSNAFGFAAT